MNLKVHIYIFRSLLIIIYSWPLLFFAQTKDQGKIDSILQLAENKSKNFDFTRSIQLGKNAVKLSRKISYHKGMIRGNFYIASGLCNLGDYKESFIYIDDIEENKEYHDYISRNPDFNFKLTDLIGRNYLALGFKKQAIKEFKKELVLAGLYDDPVKKVSQKVFALNQLSACYEDVNADSTYYYLNRITSIMKVNPYPEHELFLYLNLSDYHRNFTKNKDSVYYYNSLAIERAGLIRSPYLYLALSQKAKILSWQNKCEESLEYCAKAMEIVIRKKRIEDRISLYKLMADNYRCLGDREKELLYIDRHIFTKDSLAETRKAGIQISADRLSAETKKTENKAIEGRKIILFIIIISIALLLISGISVAKIKKRKRKIIEQKEREIKLREEQINMLSDTKQDRIREEVLLLARKNSPDFLNKFKEAYPGFYQKLLNVEPGFKNSELIFCAYLKLNFSTKEIAHYTFVTPRAVQIRKNRLRKKLNIPSDEDIYQWIEELS